ncbi:hypothetical protein MRB53_018533 [Persea americana]|uniref:Uncharacterized protein n=1 Tax=Persea americana TaxID=3435 RepID=A0ACC2M8A4_PERAE|nr:hypothetical protein MRB53_018533 [Persea americana]
MVDRVMKQRLKQHQAERRRRDAYPEDICINAVYPCSCRLALEGFNIEWFWVVFNRIRAVVEEKECAISLDGISLVAVSPKAIIKEFEIESGAPGGTKA